MIGLLDRMLHFFLYAGVERQRVEEELRKTAAYEHSLDMELLAHHVAHTEGLHRVLQRMVY